MSGWAEDVRATRDSWNFQRMPDNRVVTEFIRSFNDEELWNLDWGHISRDMDDRWCFYVEDGWASIHRSWTGICVFLLELGHGPEHTLIVNDDPQQVRFDLDEAIQTLNELIDIWSTTVDVEDIRLNPTPVAKLMNE